MGVNCPCAAKEKQRARATKPNTVNAVECNQILSQIPDVLGGWLAGNSSQAGTCSSLMVGGKQVCEDCNSFPGRQLACPGEASVCCYDGTCQQNVTGCSCCSGLQCPLHTCCTGTSDAPGHCSSQAYVQGRYVCQDCQRYRRLWLADLGDVTWDAGDQAFCPQDASVCCTDGTCAKAATQCKCRRNDQCPSRMCCSGNDTSPGVCTAQRMVRGKQTCPDCGRQESLGIPCPREASLCCGDGTCARSVEQCPCTSQDDCPPSTCCTGNATSPGHCSSKVYVKGNRLCAKCARDLNTCPRKNSVCCSDGTCRKKASLCGCINDDDCGEGLCCTGTEAKPGMCVQSAFENGKQVCAGCGTFAGRQLLCPPDKKYCCAHGHICSATLATCPCEDNSECPHGSCCTGSTTTALGEAVPGVCRSSPFQGSVQVCPDCNSLANQGLGCPQSAPVCCGDGTCKASLTQCSCSKNEDCPARTCCTDTEGKSGHCSPSLFVKGKQVCTKCDEDPYGDFACPKEASFCCLDGSCRRNVSLCPCLSHADCPFLTCCTAKSGKPGTCSPQALVNGVQVCPDCKLFVGKYKQELDCPSEAAVCCADGTCQPSNNLCTCESDYDCEYGYCCTRLYAEVNRT
eukprot:jgi/Mesen1/6433/ME000033S05721